MKTKRGVNVCFFMFEVGLLLVQASHVSAGIYDQSLPFDPQINIGDCVVIQNSIDSDDYRNGWPAIVVGKQEGAYVLLFNRPYDSWGETCWYEKITPVARGEGFPWDQRVLVFGRTCMMVKAEVVWKYIDDCGTLDVANYNPSLGTFFSEHGWNCSLHWDQGLALTSGSVRLQGLVRWTGNRYCVKNPLITPYHPKARPGESGSLAVYEKANALGLWSGAGIVLNPERISPLGYVPCEVVSLTESLGDASLKAIFLEQYQTAANLPSVTTTHAKSVAAHVTTDYGEVTEVHSVGVDSDFMLTFANGFCYELPEDERWPYLQGGRYRISGFREAICPGSSYETVESEASYCWRLGYLRAPVAVFPHQSIDEAYINDLTILENSSFRGPGGCIQIIVNGNVENFTVFGGDGGDGAPGGPGGNGGNGGNGGGGFCHCQQPGT